MAGAQGRQWASSNSRTSAQEPCSREKQAAGRVMTAHLQRIQFFFCHDELQQQSNHVAVHAGTHSCRHNREMFSGAWGAFIQMAGWIRHLVVS